MSVKFWNTAVLLALIATWFGGTTQREKPVVRDAGSSIRVDALETKAAASPNDAAALRELAQMYLDVHQPGMAIGTIERAEPTVRTLPDVEHLYARALLEQGRSASALEAERHVLATCTDSSSKPACSTWLIASATRRAEIIEQMVELGVEDATAQPEASSVAYHNATRQISLAILPR